MQMNEGKFVNKLRTRLLQIAIPAFVREQTHRFVNIFPINCGHRYSTTNNVSYEYIYIYIYVLSNLIKHPPHRVSKHRNCSSHELLQVVTPFIVSIDSFPGSDSIEYLTFVTNCVTAGYLLNLHRAYQKERNINRTIHLLPHFLRTTLPPC